LIAIIVPVVDQIKEIIGQNEKVSWLLI
jgi:hypothetical protein